MIERYKIPEISSIFSESYRYEKWLEVELEVLKVQEEVGILSTSIYESLKESAMQLDIKKLVSLAKEKEEETDHDVVAFLIALEELLGESAKYLHYGLTSSDVVDTANALIIKEALELTLEELSNLQDTLFKKALRYRNQPIMGRTHGVYAEPTSLGLKFLGFVSELKRCNKRLKNAIEEISYGKISGAVGTNAFLPVNIEERILNALGLRREPVSTQVIPRDRYAYAMTALAFISISLARLALNIRLLHQTDTGEIEEPFPEKGRGSSAMPHKKNPVKCERVVGMARMLIGYLIPSYFNILLWHERDITHSSVERMIIPDAIQLTFYMLKTMQQVVEGLVVREDRIEGNLERFGKFYLSEPVLLSLVRKGVSRRVAYLWVQDCAHRAILEKVPFEKLLYEHKDIRRYLTDEEIEGILRFDYLKNVKDIFDRFEEEV